MKRYVYMMLPALLLFVACSDKTELYRPEKETGPVSVNIPVASLSGSDGRAASTSRTPVDGWNQTTVSLAYRQESQAVYTDNVNVLVQSDADQEINMGMQYPLDGSKFYVRGHYPAAAPDASGIVRYDISRGDLDLMCTNEVYGTQDEPIIASESNKLLFRHALTRLTVNMVCAQGGSYPERIAGVIVSGNGNNEQTYLPTRAELDLSDGSVSFRVPGTIMAGYTSEGFLIPSYGNTPVVIEAMVKPESALSIRLISTGDNVTDISLENSALGFLETSGGVAGTQYIINLSFNSKTILVDQVGIVEWGIEAMPNPPTGDNQWW